MDRVAFPPSHSSLNDPAPTHLQNSEKNFHRVVYVNKVYKKIGQVAAKLSTERKSD